jgi:ABC-type branched-subunit amino acid transport system ATPase component
MADDGILETHGPAGRITFEGRDITGSRPADIARLGLVRFFQGAIFVVCVLTFRRGVIGEVGRLLREAL